MLAMVLTAPEGRGAIECRTVPRPVPEPGEALIKVHATSVMSADLPTLDGVSAPGPGLPGPTFPMIMGNEFVGEVADCPGGELRIGQRVAVGFGGYGFTRNGGHAEYVLVRVRDVWPFTSSLPATALAALPKAFGSAEMIKEALDWQKAESILIRGGSTAIGLAVAALAKADGLLVVGTTRSTAKAEQMLGGDFDHVVVDDGEISGKVLESLPGGVGAAVEMLGFPWVQDTLRCVRPLGTVCMVGILAEQSASRSTGTPQDRLAPVAPSPQWFIPAGVRLTTAMQNGVTRMKVPEPSLNHMQEWVDLLEAGRMRFPLHSVLPLESVSEAYALLENTDRIGRITLTVSHPAD